MRLSTIHLAAIAASLAAGSALAAPAVTGEYLEARSANVYVGACHHEGELLTTGRNAILAWNIQQGEFHGVSLKGIQAVAVIAAEKNLEFSDAPRRSVLYVSENASSEQRDALTALLHERAGSALGETVAVKSAAVQFDAAGDQIKVQVPGSAFLKARKEPGQLCCKQPYQVWGKPLVAVKDAKAGYCVSAEYKEKGLLQTWGTSDQNSTFFGQFSL